MRHEQVDKITAARLDAEEARDAHGFRAPQARRARNVELAARRNASPEEIRLADDLLGQPWTAPDVT